VNKKVDDKFIFMGFDKNDLIEKSCDKNNFFSLPKKSHQSLTKSLYKKFKEDYNFTPQQKHLIALIQDKHLFDYKRKESFLIDIYFHINYSKFLYLFDMGFSNFDYNSNLIIKKYLMDCEKKDSNDPIEFLYNNSYAILGNVSELPYYEYKYMKRYDSMVLIDVDIKKVFFRNKNPNYDILSFCKDYCDGGGYNDYCSGQLTEKFMGVLKNGK
jgi:hypothetical protein